MQNLSQLTNNPSPNTLRGAMREITETETRSRSANCVQLFEAQTARTPEATAVVFGDAQLSYRELNARANQLARCLRALWPAPPRPRGGVGVGLDARPNLSPNPSRQAERGTRSFGAEPIESGAAPLVGICLDRSIEMVVAVLATLKAGAAYLPLDPNYPMERVRFMLQDAGATVVLTTGTHASRVLSMPEACVPTTPEACVPAVLCLDSDWQEIGKHADENLNIDIAPQNLAYVIYTSGSTGNPKGAMITHRGLTNYLQWAVEAYDVANGCGAPVHSSISFDLTVTSLFTPLLAGRSVFLLPDGIESLADALLQRTNYSLVKITPAHLRALAEVLPPDQIAGRVRALVIGGEALHYQGLSFWREHAPATRIINEYGPTETVVGCCVYEVAPHDPMDGPVPIGHAISNTTLHLLDEDLSPVADGETGELFIGGDGVARGYLNREELTRDRFVASPFAAGEKLYRTGDLARRLPDGNVEYVCRVDDQVKIRGYRIEPGEIETVLKQHLDVSDCAVVASETAADEKRLVAFVKNDESAQWDEKALRQALHEKLPDYMVPAAFVRLASLPLTINGKIDRQALASQSGTLISNGDFIAPRTPAEETLAGIWSDVLKVDDVSINDNFFDLGGDSILGTLILARAARAGLKLSPVQLFEHQTIAELAAVAK
ncbi:MAG TPA: non-ribosomal peptide synthetase [Pyrinomonadaceae bacterium]